MEEQKKRNWAEDDSDEWDEGEADVQPPAAKLASQSELQPRPTSYGIKRDVVVGPDSQCCIEIGNLPFALDSESKILPYLIKGLAQHDLVFRPFSETPRGCVRVTTSSTEVARHLLDLDGSECAGRALRVKMADRGPARMGGGKGRRGDNRRGGGDRRTGDGRRPPVRPPFPVAIENKNAAYSRKEVDSAPVRAKPEEAKSEPVTPQCLPPAAVPAQPPKSALDRPKADPFGGAKPVDTKRKDLEYEEKLKKEKEPKAGKWSEGRSRVEPKSAGLATAEAKVCEVRENQTEKPQETPTEDVKVAEETGKSLPEKPEIPLEEPPKVAEKEAEVTKTEVKPVETAVEVAEERKPEEKEIQKTQGVVQISQSFENPNEANPRSPQVAASEPDWDFSDQGSDSRYYEDYQRDNYVPRGVRRYRVSSRQRYIRTGRMRGDRGRHDGPQSAVLHEEKKDEPVAVVEEPPKPRKRAWTSDEDDRNALSKPPAPIEPPKPVKSEDKPRGNRGRGRMGR